MHIKNITIFLTIILILILNLNLIYAISISPTIITTQVEFDKPKNQAESFYTSISLNVSNTENFPVTLNATQGNDCNGIKVLFQPITIQKNTSTSFLVDLEVPSSFTEGRHECNVKIYSITGNYSYNQNIKAIVLVKWPGPQLIVSWNEELGEKGSNKVIAGKKYKKTITIKELMGYKEAKSVTMYIVPLDYDPNLPGPAKLTQNKFFFPKIPALGTQTQEIEIEIPERNLIPGNYTLQTRVKAMNNKETDNIDSYNTYQIPYPIMKISGDLNFGDLTFTPGKDNAIKNLIISEVSGFTPIEGISVEKISGEDGWITLPTTDYVAPGQNENFSFKISLPYTATLGKKEWKFKIKTKFAGEKEFSASTLIYFPNIDENLNEIKNFEKNAITENLIKMLNLAKELTENQNIQDLANVIYVYSASKSLLLEISSMKNTSDEDEKLKHIFNIKKAINKLKNINEKFTNKNFNDYLKNIEKYSDSLWNKEVADEIEKIKENLKSYEKDNYKSCATKYKKLGEIYGKNFEEKEICEKKYIESIEKIEKLKKNLTTILNSIDANTINIGVSKAVINPFAYDFVLKCYNYTDKIYENIILLYNISGEKEEAIVYEAKRNEKINEKAIIESFFMIYGIIVGLIMIFIVTRIILGFVNYKRDEEEIKIGDVVLG